MHAHDLIEVCTSSAVRWLLGLAGVLLVVMAARAVRGIPAEARPWLRPIWLSIAASMAGEFVIWVVFGLVLFPEGDPFAKLIWTVVFCGLGMGATVGGMVSLFVVGRMDGGRAIAATTALALVVLGVACDVLCLNLDVHYFHYFGGEEAPGFFLLNGLVMSGLGGLAIGALLFTERGRGLLDRWGL